MKYVAFVDQGGEYCGWTSVDSYSKNRQIFDTDEDIREFVEFDGPEYPDFGSLSEVDRVFAQVSELAEQAVRRNKHKR